MFLSKVRYSETDTNKINDLAEHLLSRPGIKSEPLPVAEGMVVSFLMQNLPRLKTVFGNNQFFPHLEWSEVLDLLLENLYRRVSGAVLPVVNRFVNSADFSFLDKMSDAGAVDDRFRREKLYEFFQMIFINREARINFSSMINIFNCGAVERYTGEIFRRRDFLHNELVLMQKTNIDCDEYIVFLKTILLVRNIVFLPLPLDQPDTELKKTIADIGNEREKAESYAGSVVQYIIPLLPGFPQRLLHLAVKSNFPSELTADDQPSSKLVYILSGRFRNYNKDEKTDRGSEPPDKSWFAVAKKNAEYSGYDPVMLDALYIIAEENNW